MRRNGLLATGRHERALGRTHADDDPEDRQTGDRRQARIGRGRGGDAREVDARRTAAHGQGDQGEEGERTNVFLIHISISI